MKIIELNLENIINELLQLCNDEDDSYKETIFMELLGDKFINFIDCINNNYSFSTTITNNKNSSYTIYCDSIKYLESKTSIKINELYPYYVKIIDNSTNNIIFNYFINDD